MLGTFLLTLFVGVEVCRPASLTSMFDKADIRPSLSLLLKTDWTRRFCRFLVDPGGSELDADADQNLGSSWG